MPSRPILESHPVSVLRKEISKTNIKGYSKMKKAEVISLMLKRENASKFSHIKMNEKSKPKEITIVPKRKIKAERAKKISAPKREAQKATVIPPKKRVASVPKVVKAKAPLSIAELKERRGVVNAEIRALRRAGKNPSPEHERKMDELKKLGRQIEKAEESSGSLSAEKQKSLLEDILSEAEEYRLTEYVADKDRITITGEMSKKRMNAETKAAKKLIKLTEAFLKSNKTPRFNAYWKKLLSSGDADYYWDGEDLGPGSYVAEADIGNREREGSVLQYGESLTNPSINYLKELAEKYEKGMPK